MIDPLRAVELYDELGAALGGGACALMILCGIAFAVRDAAALWREVAAVLIPVGLLNQQDATGDGNDVE